jgi:acetate kinase
VRALICEGRGCCGLGLDPAVNQQAVGIEARIGRDDAPMQAWVIPTDEELIIARRRPAA